MPAYNRYGTENGELAMLRRFFMTWARKPYQT